MFAVILTVFFFFAAKTCGPPVVVKAKLCQQVCVD